jgi:DNA-binding IclR family transcriptional regulator
LKILDILGQAQDGVSITELAENLGVDKGSASRLVATLVNFGYAEKDEQTRRFHLALRWYRLAAACWHVYPYAKWPNRSCMR